MGTPDFRFNPHWPEIAEHFDGFSDISLVEMLNRRDVQLEDWLAHFGGGREYSTIVIAASDTNRSGKNKANLVCDGSADQEIINRAWALLPTINLFGSDYLVGKVLFLEGNFSVTGAIAPTATVVCEVEGMGSYETLFTVPTGTNGTFTMFDSGLLTTAVRKVQFDPNSTGQSSGTITGIDGAAVVEDCILGGAGGFGTSLQGVAATGVSVLRDCQVLGRIVGASDISRCSTGNVSATASMSMDECSTIMYLPTAPAIGVDGIGAELTLTNSRVQYGLASAQPLVRVDAQAPVSGVARRTHISGNEFYGSASSVSDALVEIIRTSSAVVADNTLDSLCGGGIFLEGCTGTVVVGNTIGGIDTAITANTRDFITLKSDASSGGCLDCYVLGNALGRDNVPGYAQPRHGIRIDDAACTNNTVIPNAIMASVGGSQISDAGTGTIKTFAANSIGPSLSGTTAQADDAALFWMGNQPGPAASATSAAVVPALSGTTAQADDAALFWMGNEPEPSAAPAIAALTVLTAMGGY